MVMIKYVQSCLIIKLIPIFFSFSYFRHAYQLGEHYNSVMPNRDVADEEEWRDNSE